MKKSIWVILALTVLLLAVCLGLAGVRRYQNQYTYVGERRYEKNVGSLDLSGQQLENVDALAAFTNLKQIDLRGTGLTCLEYDRVKAWFPGAKILWDIPFQGSYYPMDTEELTVVTLAEADLAVLDYFPSLRAVNAHNCPDYQNLDALRQQRPDLELSYRVPVAGNVYVPNVKALILPGEYVEELFEKLPLFPELREVELQAPLAPAERIMALREAFPEISFSWDLELAGIPVDESTETLNLTGIPLTVEQMDAVLPYLPSLTYVDMTDCGISNEEMDDLNARYENIKIVWTVILGGWYRIRTDATSFMPVKDNFHPWGDDLYNLRYCHDMIALDIGHRLIHSCEWAAYMPHLQYLLLADTDISDLTPLAGLKELKYLEIFMTPVQDYTPLLSITSLEDLNICYTLGDPEIIAQMTWLKNLWWGYWAKINLDPSCLDMIRQALPECNICFDTGSSTDMGWRELPNYYAQRDIFGMEYMKG